LLSLPHGQHFNLGGGGGGRPPGRVRRIGRIGRIVGWAVVGWTEGGKRVVSFDSGEIGDRLGDMQKILPLFLAAAVFAVGACSNHDKPKKSSAHIYPGDAPTIKFMDEPEAAGGPIKGY